MSTCPLLEWNSAGHQENQTSSVRQRRRRRRRCQRRGFTAALVCSTRLGCRQGKFFVLIIKIFFQWGKFCIHFLLMSLVRWAQLIKFYVCFQAILIWVPSCPRLLSKGPFIFTFHFLRVLTLSNVNCGRFSRENNLVIAESNPRPHIHEVAMLTTTLPSQPAQIQA